MKQIILCAIAMAAAATATAGVNSPGVEGYLERGRAMYEDANYTGCIDQLTAADRSILSDREQEETDWLIACACYHVQGGSAISHFAAFLQRYPASLHRSEAWVYMANCVMARSYADALKLYQQINPATLSEKMRREWQYCTAFCQLKLADYDRAEQGFRQLSESKQYGAASRFYMAYIAYARGNYGEAKQLFQQVNTATAPGNMADYYLAQIYYSEQNWEKALSTARKLLRNSGVEPGYQAEANRLVGESLFRLDRPAEAVEYLERYVAATEQPALSALYILGMSQYQSGDYAQAVESLRPVAQSDDAMGQSALLYIGQALLKEGDTDAALISLDKALRMNFDKSVQEAAFYNYAVAKYRGGRIPFGSSVATFEEFLRRYPDSRYAPEVQEYVVDGWLNDNNYESALESIRNMKNPGARVQSAKQQVLYVLGARALATGDVAKAVAYLKESASHDRYNAAVALQNALVLGEAYYRQGDMQASERQFDKYLAGAGKADANYAVGRYDRGYARFGRQDYSRAAEDFAYVAAQKGLPAATRADAYNRLADTYYYKRDFARASANYSEAYELQPESGDYPLFQQAVMLGLERRYADKKERLSHFMEQFTESVLAAEALLELAETETALGNTDATASTYLDLINRYPATAQARAAYLRLGSMQLTGGARDMAIGTFKQLIVAAPTSDEARLATDYLKRIGAEDGSLGEVRQFLAGVDNAPQIDVAEADRITFVTAEEAYDDKGDVSKLEKYLSEYPDGAFVPQALGYLLEQARGQGDDKRALYYAKAIVERFPDNVRAESALATIGDIEYSRGNAAAAMKAYQRLEQSASSTASQNSARMGEMRAALDLGRWNEVVAAADKLLASSATGGSEKSEVIFAKALALEKSGKRSEARKLWDDAAGDTDELSGAKSAYYLAQSYFDDKQLDEAREAAEYLVQSHTPHSYWLARGFIVLSDVYRAQGRKFEADSYLEALRKNYPGQESDIFQMIDSRLAK